MAASSTGSSGVNEPALLEKIDKLFAVGVGDHIDLPQLVIVGDQSSGKSSVLEGLTNLPFPRDSDLCTRFATRITFQRAAQPSISVSIIPAGDASREHAERVKAWSKPNMMELSSESFAQIMREVCDVMNIKTNDVDGSLKPSSVTFSEDVLKIDIRGPEEEHFSVIDIPGVFKKTTEGVTTKADMHMVRNMVQGYINNPRSVILAVIPANIDVANQEVLTMAEEADEDGLRTLGVLTKPDLVDQGAEQTIMDMIEGHKHRLKHGWCVVRNLGQHQIKNAHEDRHRVEEDFFRFKAPWNTISKDKVGIGALRQRLQEILRNIIRHSFRQVRSDITKKLGECQKALHALGQKRETSEEQRVFLTKMSTEFQEVVKDALSAKYIRDEKWFNEKQSHRLATTIIKRHLEFSADLEQKGHRYSGETEDTDESEEDEGVQYIDSSSHEGSDVDPKLQSWSELLTEKWGNHLFIEAPELEEVFSKGPEPPVEPSSKLHEWMTSIYEESRGLEISNYNPELLSYAMNQQSRNWTHYAIGYIDDMIVMAHEFMSDLLMKVCPDTQVRYGLRDLLMDKLVDRYKAARERVWFLLDIERNGLPATLNPSFAQSVTDLRRVRTRAELMAISEHVESNSKRTRVVRIDRFDNSRCSQHNNSDHVVRELVDTLEAYYEVARKRFVDTVCMQAANHFLVTGKDTPLRFFSPDFVQSLSVEQLDEVAGEDASVRRKRKTLAKEIAALEEGKKIVSKESKMAS